MEDFDGRMVITPLPNNFHGSTTPTNCPLQPPSQPTPLPLWLPTLTGHASHSSCTFQPPHFCSNYFCPRPSSILCRENVSSSRVGHSGSLPCPHRTHLHHRTAHGMRDAPHGPGAAWGLAVQGLREAGGDSDVPLSDHPSPVDAEPPGEGRAPTRPTWSIRFQPPSSLLPSCPKL